MSDALVDIVLLDPGQRRVPLYKAVERFTALDHDQARMLVDAAPQVIVTRVPHHEASGMKAWLEGFGAALELRPATAPGAATDFMG